MPADEKRGLVLTADVIAPLVDDAETFGRIAATNSISDIYAMGGRPLYALNLVFFPDDLLPGEILDAMLAGGARACADAGVAIIGGHTVRDKEVKYGLSVTGEVVLDELLTNRTAGANQTLVLTKALGTGIIGTALKKDLASPEEIDAAVTSMTTHNGGALEVARRHRVTSATDVTGFGLLGHLRNILRGSSLAAELWMSELPLLPGAREHAAEGRVPGGSRANLAFIEPLLTITGVEDPLLTLLAADAQTSGGLLLCVEEDDTEALLGDLEGIGLPARAVGRTRALDSDEPAGSTELVYPIAETERA
jgi:selenide,water dikinase